MKRWMTRAEVHETKGELSHGLRRWLESGTACQNRERGTGLVSMSIAARRVPPAPYN